MTRLTHLKLAGLVAALSIMLGACATGPPDELQKARQSYDQAKQTQATEYAPTELQEARKALIRAERAFQDQGNSETTRTLSYVATREAQQAVAKAQVNYLATQHQNKQDELFAATESARRHYREEAQRQRQMREMTTQELEQQQNQLERMQANLDEMRERLEDEGMSEEEIRQAMRDELEQQGLTEEQLAQMTEQELEEVERDRQIDEVIARLEAEIERREQAEQRLTEAMNRLDEIADVREEDGRGRIVTLDNQVLFEFGESELRPEARSQLNQVADILRMQEDARYIVEGHTDAIGSEEFNERLSEQRAQAVRDFLTERGVSDEQVQIRGYGEARPVASNESPEGRAMNRRVEIVIQTPDEAIGGGPDQQDQEDQQDQQDQQDQPMEQQDQQPMEQQDQQPMEQPEQDDQIEQPEDEDMLEEQPEDEDMLEEDEEFAPDEQQIE
ncbi:MAG: OmpA family protein [Persicimonas sp.]